jgi:sugar O-acyltransferase (sialic acid O-acetyltransferase NeuD family)
MTSWNENPNHAISDDLIICGAGGFAREAAVWARQAGRRIIGFYADGEKGNRDIFGLPVLGDLSGFQGPVEFLVAIGDPGAKERVWNRALVAGKIPCRPIIHPSAVVGDADIGVGSILCPGVVLTTNVKIGSGVILNLNVTVGHDTQIGSFTTVSPGANISGNVKVGVNSYIGTNAVIREKLSMGTKSVLGMGAVLVKSIPDGETWVGNPAKMLGRH